MIESKRYFLLVTYAMIALVICLINQGEYSRLYAQNATSHGGERDTRIADFDGIWDSSYGKIELAQVDLEVFGRYESSEGKGLIEGTVEASVLTYIWTLYPEDAPVVTGNGEFRMEGSGESYEGWWVYEGEKKNRNDWNATRYGDREIEETRPELDFCLWRGAWNTGSGAIIIEQTSGSNEVTGQFMHDEIVADFTGIADGWELEIEWVSERRSGDALLEMNTSLDTFTGSISSNDGSYLADWTGDFTGTEEYQNFSGTWDLSWGRTVLTSDTNSGALTGVVESAKLGRLKGECIIDGVVLVNTCVFTWSLDTRDGTTTGTGFMSIQEDDGELSGSWDLDGGSASGYLSGTRR